MDLLPSLSAVHCYVQHLQFSLPFPAGVEVGHAFFQGPGTLRAFHAWELDLLARETLLNCPMHGSDALLSWNGMANTINDIRKIENESHRIYSKRFAGKILIEVFRIAHRQFPWQRRPATNRLVRYYKIFSRPDLNRLLIANLGVDAVGLYRFGLAILAIFMERAFVNDPIANELPGLSDLQFRRLLDRFTRSLSDIKQAIQGHQSYDEDYAYTFNELKVSPIIRIPQGTATLLSAPIPTHLFSRFTEGVYYDLVGVPGFSDAFGPAFQQYVGDVLRAANLGASFHVLEERSYTVGRRRKDTVDWIVYDGTADIFVECKASRVRYAAKIALSTLDELEADLEKLADALVQIYKTIEDAKAGRYPQWQFNGRPIYPVIVTLEDWYFHGHDLIRRVDGLLRQKLADAGLHVEIATEHPYSICSVEDFEDLVRVVKHEGIDRVMRFKTTGEHRYWLMFSALRPEFRDALHRDPHNLFPEESRRIGLLDSEAE